MRIFILEDNEERMRIFREWLGPEHSITHIKTVKDVDKFNPPYEWIFFDFDLGHVSEGWDEQNDNGSKVALALKDKINESASIVIHSYNPGGAEAIKNDLKGLGASKAPFGSKLFTDIMKFISRGSVN